MPPISLSSLQYFPSSPLFSLKVSKFQYFQREGKLLFFSFFYPRNLNTCGEFLTSEEKREMARGMRRVSASNRSIEAECRMERRSRRVWRSSKILSSGEPNTNWPADLFIYRYVRPAPTVAHVTKVTFLSPPRPVSQHADGMGAIVHSARRRLFFSHPTSRIFKIRVLKHVFEGGGLSSRFLFFAYDTLSRKIEESFYIF